MDKELRCLYRKYLVLEIITVLCLPAFIIVSWGKHDLIWFGLIIVFVGTGTIIDIGFKLLEIKKKLRKNSSET